MYNICAGAVYHVQYAGSTAFSPLLGTIQFVGGADGTKSTNITGLTPSTTYFFRFYSLAGQSCGASAAVYSSTRNFTTAANLNVPLAEYNFNDTYNNVAGSVPFSLNPGTSFVNGRNAAAGKALNINNTGTSASIVGLPVGDSPRTVSLWFRVNQLSNSIDNYLFCYGTTQANSAYGFSFRTNQINNLAWTNDLTKTKSITTGVWRHLVCTYDTDKLASIYIDGVLETSELKTAWNTSSSSSLQLGRLTSTGATLFNGIIDDLKIYNRALSSLEVTQLFTNNTLSAKDFKPTNLQVSIYPNPANNVLNLETTHLLKSIEIYTMQGQKVLSAANKTKQINISDLASGMYMIRIVDADNGVSTKKFVKK